MREILFRGFHECSDGETVIVVEGKEIRGRWIYGLPSYSKNGLIEEIEVSVKDGTDANVQAGSILFFSVIPFTVGQFTDFKDKNGDKVFENDVIKKSSGRTCRVGWEHHSRYIGWDFFGYKTTIKHGYCSDVFVENDFEVIGTIFDKQEEIQ